MQKYKINISKQAKVDIKNIVNYIKNVLIEPIIASRYSKLIKDKIYSLEYFSERFGIISSELIKNKIYRKLVVKNYIVIYRVDKEKNVVHIVRVVYAGMDWENKL